MLLTAEQIQIRDLVQMNGKGKPAQVGIDLTIKAISQIKGGKIYEEKAIIYPYEKVESDEYTFDLENVKKEGWILGKGMYSLTFDQGIKLNSEHCAQIVHRSSLLRSSAIITSGMFDNGFKCDEIGATMVVFEQVFIEVGARIAQIIVHETGEVSDIYNGNYQGDKDKK